jgi:hypothetical protein
MPALHLLTGGRGDVHCLPPVIVFDKVAHREEVILA